VHPARNMLLASAALALITATGCGGGSGQTAAGTSATTATASSPAPAASAPTVTLHVGTDDDVGLPSTAQIDEFARQVHELSGGTITVKPALHAAGDGDDWDQRVARMVVAGDLEMGLIPSRAWDTEGVTSLRALNAPFLVTSDAVLDQVIVPPLADDLMGGLDKAGVVGLALFPEGLRHPFGLTRPLFAPADYANQLIRSPTSATTASMFQLLGAKVDQGEVDPARQAAMESSYLLDVTGTSTGNVTFFPKVNSLVVNEKVLSGLTEDQRKILRDAAANTRAWAIETTPTDATAAQHYCESGGSVVLAPAAAVTALEKATKPLYRELEQDPSTKQLIAEIRAIKATSSDTSPVEACGTGTP
jgi:TRAP-type C4-dicarboxylate transport system substrate-binding protein